MFFVLELKTSSLSSFESSNYFNQRIQDEIVINATYDEHEDYGYNFLYKDAEGEEKTITFHKVEQSVLDGFDLNAEALIKTKFKITYKISIKKSKDEFGNEDEDEIFTIIKLEKL